MLLAVGLVIAVLAVVTTLLLVFRKAKRTPLPFDDLDDLPTIGGGNQARMARKRQGMGASPVTSAPVAVQDDVSNMILMHAVANATFDEPTRPHPVHAHAAPTPAPEPCVPVYDAHTSTYDSSHCSSSSDYGGGGGYDGGGGGGCDGGGGGGCD